MRSSSLRNRIYQHHRHEMIIDSDLSHCEAWKEEKKPQQRELVQMVQIDHVLHGVIRQRMFGNILNKKGHLMADAYGELERSTIDTFAGWEITNARRMTAQSYTQPVITQPMTAVPSKSRAPKLNRTVGGEAFKSRRRMSRQSIETNFSPGRRRQSIGEPLLRFADVSEMPSLDINNSPGFQQFFRKLVNLPQRGILVEAKVTKQQIKQLFRPYKLNSDFLDRFLTFFDMPAYLFYRQFVTHMESVVNKTTLREVDFLVFQMLDRDNDGLVSIGDLFRFLGENGGAGILIERDVFACSGFIQKKKRNLMSFSMPSDNKEVKTDEILICNHSIRLDTYRQLVKDDNNKQLVGCPAMKSTIYHQTFHAIEHQPKVRLKNYHLQQNQSQANINKKDNSGTVDRDPVDHLTLQQFYRMFNRDRPNIFYFVVEVITGQLFGHLHS